jgi:uncharacterized protein (TIGR03437 family)
MHLTPSWRAVLVAVGASLTVAVVPAQQYLQQGSKLTGSASSDAMFGSSVAVSGDGSTAAIVGPRDGSTTKGLQTGAVWVFTRQAGVWTQQGNKILPPAGANSVALAGDGNTLFVGSPGDGTFGSVQIYSRNGSTWQTGAKLTGAGVVFNIYSPGFGSTLAVSRDGNTLAVGAPGDNANAGAVWIFVRTNGVWTQQGNKLVITTAGYPLPGSPQGWLSFGASVALTPDGSTLVAGAPVDLNGRGAAHLFHRTTGVWSETAILQGPTKIPDTGNDQGTAVAISDDANTVLVGASEVAWVHVRQGAGWKPTKLDLPLNEKFGSDIKVALAPDGSVAFLGALWNSDKTGSVWPFRPFNGVWRQDGRSLLGTGALGAAGQGNSLALSVDASTLLIGGASDATHDTVFSTGAAWVFVRPDVALTPQLAPSPSVYGASVQLTALVTPASANVSALPALPTGTVQFADGQTQLGVAAVVGSAAGMSIPVLGAGTHSISAAYSGDANWYPATAAATHVVNPASTNVTLTLQGGAAPGLLATVASAAGGLTGSVQFLDATRNSSLGAVSLSGSSMAARLPLDAAQFRAAAGHSVTASYSGDANFRPSISTPLSLPVMMTAVGAVSPVFAPEQLVTVYGSQLAAETAQAGGVPWPLTLGKTIVNVADSAGISRSAGLLYVSPGQINFQIPAGTALGDAVIVISGPTASIAIPVPFAAVAPGIFTVSGNGEGLAAAQTVRLRPDGNSVTETITGPIDFGQDELHLVLYGTGLRNRSSLSDVRCVLNGEALPVEYAGPQGQYPGLDQVNVKLPPSLRGAGLVKVQLSVGVSTANTAELVFQ